MTINYKLGNINQTYDFKDKSICSFLTNQKGDSILLSNNPINVSYFGFSFYHKNLGYIKLFNQFELENVQCNKIIYEGFKVTNTYNSKFCNSSENISEIYYLGPSGGLVYFISGYQGRIKLNFDIRKLFSNISAIYSVCIENNIIFIKGILETEEFYIGINSQNISYHLIKEFETKNYIDSIKVDLFKIIEFDIATDKKIFIGTGLSKLEVLEQLQLLEFHYEELMNFDSHICSEVLKNIEFEKPIQENFSLAYTQSIFTFHQLFKRTLGNKINNFLISGFPTNGVNIFDELLALRSLINREDFMEVKIKLEYLLTLINNSTGFFPLNENSTKTSLSGLFLLVKRIEDLIFALDEKNKLYEFFTYKELEIIYLKLVKSFNLITQNNWSEDFSLLFSQMEDLSIEVEEGGFYLETQVGYLNFISVLTTFSTILHKKEAKSYLELEQDLKSKIRKDFFTNNILIHKLEELDITSSIFIAYYYYPDLLLKKEWEEIFDFTIKRLKTNMGFNIYSKFHKFSKASIYLHSNEEVKKDESLIWLNHIAAIVMYHCSPSKFREIIRDIIINSSNSISNQGIIGSSQNALFNKKENEFPNISLSATATFLELIELIYK